VPSACHSQLTWLNPDSNHLLATSYHMYLIGLGSWPLWYQPTASRWHVFICCRSVVA